MGASALNQKADKSARPPDLISWTSQGWSNASFVPPRAAADPERAGGGGGGLLWPNVTAGKLPHEMANPKHPVPLLPPPPPADVGDSPPPTLPARAVPARKFWSLVPPLTDPQQVWWA